MYEAAADLKSLEELGKAFVRSTQFGYGAANVFAELVDTCRAAYKRAKVNGPVVFTSVPPATLDIADATYTMLYEDGSYFTFRIRTAKSGKFEGKRLCEYLNGPNNELDFQAFAFVNERTINVWRRFERGPLVNRAREIEAMVRNNPADIEAAGLRYAEVSNRCRHCNKVLTVPTSLAAGYGETCARNLGIAYGDAEPVRRTRRPRSTEPTAEPTTEEPTATADEFAGKSDEEINDLIDRASRASMRNFDAFENLRERNADEHFVRRAEAELARRQSWNGRQPGFDAKGFSQQRVY